MYTIFTADNINTTTRLTLNEADGFYIKAGVTVANTVGTAIGGATASFVNGVIDGTLSGAFWGILLEGSGSKFSVGKTGVVFGSEAFDLRGHGLSVENEGRILGDFGIHFEIDAPSLKPSQIKLWLHRREQGDSPWRF
jgi:hypothetical protein